MLHRSARVLTVTGLRCTRFAGKQLDGACQTGPFAGMLVSPLENGGIASCNWHVHLGWSVRPGSSLLRTRQLPDEIACELPDQPTTLWVLRGMTNHTTQRIGITHAVRHHIESAKLAVLGTPYWVWPMPLLLCAAILLILQTPIGWFTEKPVQEIVAPVVLGITAVLALFVYYRVRAFFTLLLACFAWALFLRELHFLGTNNGFYVAVILLAWLASSRRDAIHQFLRRRSIGALLSCSLWTYFVTKLIDRHYLSFLPEYVDWHDSVEESLETLGHLMVFALVVVALRVGNIQGRTGVADEPDST